MRVKSAVHRQIKQNASKSFAALEAVERESSFLSHDGKENSNKCVRALKSLLIALDESRERTCVSASESVDRMSWASVGQSNQSRTNNKSAIAKVEKGSKLDKK